MNRIDLLLFGATGYTGKHVAKGLAKWEMERGDVEKFTWGLCGRSKHKINALLMELEEMGVDVSRIPVFECSVKSDDARNVTCKANVVLNCTGPSIILSEPIVKACIDTSTHYVDISAERYHMLYIYSMYNKLAEDANVLIIPACGFAVIPAVSGLMYLENKFQGTLNTVQCYTTIEVPKRAYVPFYKNCLVNSGTWESMIHEFGSYGLYQRLKQEVYPKIIREEEPPEIKKSFFHKHGSKIWFPYPGPECETIELSQIYLSNKKASKFYHFKMYATTPLLIQLFMLTIVFFIYYCLSFMKCFRKLLCRYPGAFSGGFMTREGPTEEMCHDTKFCMSFIGKGVKNNMQESMTVKVSGRNPAYDVTSNALIASALTLLRERSSMPSGGVVFPSAAFRDTRLVNTLICNNCLEYE